MDVVIQNTADLKLEIARLKQLKNNQEVVIKQHFNSPRAILGTIAHLFSKHKSGSDIPDFKGGDISAWLSKLLLPITLNKTLFRKSGFIVKALVGLLSQKASGLVNDKNVGSLWHKVKSLLPHSITSKIPFQKKKPFFKLLPLLKTP